MVVICSGQYCSAHVHCGQHLYFLLRICFSSLLMSVSFLSFLVITYECQKEPHSNKRRNKQNIRVKVKALLRMLRSSTHGLVKYQDWNRLVRRNFRSYLSSFTKLPVTMNTSLLHEQLCFSPTNFYFQLGAIRHSACLHYKYKIRSLYKINSIVLWQRFLTFFGSRGRGDSLLREHGK